MRRATLKGRASRGGSAPSTCALSSSSSSRRRVSIPRARLAASPVQPTMLLSAAAMSSKQRPSWTRPARNTSTSAASHPSISAAGGPTSPSSAASPGCCACTRASTSASPPGALLATSSSWHPRLVSQAASAGVILSGRGRRSGGAAWYLSPTRDSDASITWLPPGDSSPPSSQVARGPGCSWRRGLRSRPGRPPPLASACATEPRPRWVRRMPCPSSTTRFRSAVSLRSMPSARRSHTLSSTLVGLLPSARPTSRAAAASQLCIRCSLFSMPISCTSVRQRNGSVPGRQEG
mmetsp:Transcript_34469/g.86935  ORF Transcript_34469/g.86935 Transcript_34469/m.86935 type:complete len:292 (+) Transcript_34469:1114-1989(+)